MHNFIAYFRKGGSFLKSYWAKWPRKQLAFLHGRTVKGVESNIFTCKPRPIFKTIELIRLSQILSNTNHDGNKAANSKAFMCKLGGNKIHSKDLITWAGEAMRMNIVLPALLFLACFIRLAARQAWLRGKFPPTTILVSQLTGLARLSYNRKVDFCYV